MEDHSILVIVTTLVGALGIKEIWNIWKKKIDIDAQKDIRDDEFSVQVINELKNKIESLEQKIDALIKENIELHTKIARMEERLMQRAKTSTRKPATKKTTKK